MSKKHVPYPVIAERKLVADDVTQALPKMMELVDEFGKYGVRRKVGNFHLPRANGAPTVTGLAGYNIANYVRLTQVGKWLAFVPVPWIMWKFWVHHKALSTEYDLHTENLTPHHAKKNPAHGH
eukprot:NODE_11977_length_528_cov_81.809877_g11689_i0.p2 GENE.NODE_11977_length_528_cov_81.809877_g11689_i0~~NODE_11977_length_528_cov_81.809877_g11689_i0.p2  ORF type:complete len:123 (+),score=30.42 NODE_11977_length_528_cov_81.809877_g11689_i0:57-425(+)